WLQIETPHLTIPVEQATDLPGDAFVHHAVADAETVEDFERALRPADGAAAARDDVVVIENDASDAVQRAVNSRAEADRPCPDDDDGRTCGGFAAQLGRCPIGERTVVVTRQRL